MDWFAFFKDYPLVIPALATVMVTILGYFFVRWNSTHNKNLEIQKKEYDRRASIHDMRIKEAREYINILHETFHSSGKLITNLIITNALTGDERIEIEELIDQLLDLTDKGGKQSISIYVFNDNELESMHDSILSIYMSGADYVAASANRTLRGKSAELDKEKLREIKHSYAAGEGSILLLKRKLDELARTVK